MSITIFIIYYYLFLVKFLFLSAHGNLICNRKFIRDMI